MNQHEMDIVKWFKTTNKKYKEYVERESKERPAMISINRQSKGNRLPGEFPKRFKPTSCSQ